LDFLWRKSSLIVETDGFRYHRGRAAFEDDRARDLELRLLGYDVLRFTYRQLSGNPGGVARALCSFL
jgi:very-short-patch-repair endonuclease